MKAGKAAVAVAAVAAVIGLSACAGSHIQPSLGQYAITTGHGNFSSQQVQNVAPPGSDIHLGSGTTTWYVYSDVRNYVTGQNGDRPNSTQLLTGTGPKGEPAIPVYVDSYVPFELNPHILAKAGNWSFAASFLSFCLKYACASQTPQNDTSNANLVKSSSPGWENMLNEIMPVAIDNSTRQALAGFPPSVWSDQSQWPALAAAIGKTLGDNLNGLDGSPSGEPYFCGIGSTINTCKPITGITIRKITPPAAVAAAYGQGNAAVYQNEAARSRVAAAEILYGKDANWVLGIEDLENNCPVKCNFYVGNAPINPGH